MVNYTLLAMMHLPERLQLSNFLLLGFILVLPLSVRHTLVSWSPIGTSGFNEYTDISVFLSDIVLLAFILLKLIEHRLEYLSITWWRELFHVEQWKLAVLSPLPFLLWSLVSTLWSENQSLAFYASIKLFEGYMLYLFLLISFVPRGTLRVDEVKCSTWNISDAISPDRKMFHVEQVQAIDSRKKHSVPRGTISVLMKYISKCSTWNILVVVIRTIILSAFIQSLIAIYQFLAQKSTGLAFLGETHLGVEWPGIAKIIIYGESVVRPYGLFPHPNVLAAFIGFAIILVLTYSFLVTRQLFHVEQSRTYYRLVLATLGFVFLIAFSKAAMASLILAVFYICWQLFHVEQLVKKSDNISSLHVPRGTFLYLKNLILYCSTWNIRTIMLRMFHVEQLLRILLVVLILLVTAIVARSLDWQYFLYQPAYERWQYVHSFYGMIKDSFWLGLGIGQSVYLMQHFIEGILFDWQFQPIHNLIMLIWTEVGLIGLILFGYLCSTWNKITQIPRMLHVEQGSQKFCGDLNNVPRGTIYPGIIESIFSRGILLYVILTSLFDHYYWDIQQGQLLFWVACSLALSLRLRYLTK